MDSDLYPHEFLENMVSIHDAERAPVKSADRKPGPYPYYGASGITDYVDSFIFDGDFVLLAEDGDNLRSRKTPIAFMARSQFWVNNHAHVLKGKDGNDTAFVCYALQIADVDSYISGSTRPKITQRDMRKIPIFSPPKPQQRAIARILGTLDDKIEINRQMNATLEAMAQALFKSWFVDFDPVIDNALAAGNTIPETLQARAETRTALGDQRKPLPEDIQQHFPSSFVFNEELGWVPEGWNVLPFGDLIETAIGGDWGKEEVDEKHQRQVSIIRGTDIPAVKSGAVGNTPMRWVEEKKLSTRELCDGDIVIEVSGGSPKQPTGRAVYITAANLEVLGGSCVPASFCRKFRPKSKVHGIYAAQHLDRIYSLGKMWSYQNQSTGISNFQTNTFLETEFVALPRSDFILKEFFKLARPMIDKCRSSEKEELARLRDTLLPKLLSGQLRIPEAEEQFAKML